jgi:hypothetical protein
MGSCVLRETIPKGRPRFAPRVSLSLIVCVCLHTGARRRRGDGSAGAASSTLVLDWGPLIP